MTLKVPIETETRISEQIASAQRTQGEHPSVVLGDLAGRRRPTAHVIAFANEKGGVGKSTLAFHCALALAHLGKQVLVIDCDRRQQSLHRFMEARDATIRTLKAPLPQPKHAVLQIQSGALLLQEMERVGRDCDFVLVDLAGHDSPTGRRAIAMADTVVTPVAASPADLDALGSINPVTHRWRRAGSFADVVSALREERITHGHGPFDWVVVQNRLRHCERRLMASAHRDLATMSQHLGFRVLNGLTERLAYRELLTFGLSHLDLKLIPRLGRSRTIESHELQQLIEGLVLPLTRPVKAAASRPAMRPAPVPSRVLENYWDALIAATPARAS